MMILTILLKICLQNLTVILMLLINSNLILIKIYGKIVFREVGNKLENQIYYYLKYLEQLLIVQTIKNKIYNYMIHIINKQKFNKNKKIYYKLLDKL